MKKQAEDWERRAMLAVQEGRDDLAKQALMRYNEALRAPSSCTRPGSSTRPRPRSSRTRCAAQRQDRRGQAQEEHPGRAGQPGRGAAADPGDDVRHVRQERVRVVRADGREDRGPGAQGHGLGGAAGGILRRPPDEQFEALEYKGSSDQQLLELKAKMGLLGARAVPALGSRQGQGDKVACGAVDDHDGEEETQGPSPAMLGG